jgi:hypothetical protein
MKSRIILLSAGLAAAGLLAACNGDDNGGSGASSGASGYAFATTPASDYTQVDRMGGPVVATVLLPCDGNLGCPKDLFNQAQPGDDGNFANMFIATLKLLHWELDDQLASLKLKPCATIPSTATSSDQVDVTRCVSAPNNAAAVLIPDVLHLDISQPSGFPNGRTFTDSVADITLALALLDLGEPGQTLNTFVSLPLNPPANDKPYPTDFPYLADPWPLKSP